jgi:hypothetical protein
MSSYFGHGNEPSGTMNWKFLDSEEPVTPQGELCCLETVRSFEIFAVAVFWFVAL